MKPAERHYLSRGACVFIAACALFAATGCETAAGKKERAMMMQQIASIEDRVGFIYNNARAQADVAANLAMLQDSMVTLRGQIEELNARSEMLGGKIDESRKSIAFSDVTEGLKAANIRLEKISERLNGLNVELMAYISLMEKKHGVTKSSHRRAVESLMENGGVPGRALSPGGGAAGAQREKPPEPGELYQNSYNHYLKGDYGRAIEGFSLYLDNYPGTSISDNAAFWIAESHYAMKDYENAVKAYDSLVDKYPASNKAPSSLMKSATALSKLGDEQGERKRLRMIIERYPASNEAITASERLDKDNE